MDDFLTNFVSEKIQEAAAIALLASNDVKIKIEKLTSIIKPIAVKTKKNTIK